MDDHNVASRSANVYVTYHWFGVTDQGELPVETGNWANGLVRAMSVGATIYTGIDTGNVRVTAVTREDAPADIDPGPWDEIVETSIFSAHGQLRVDSPQTGLVDTLPPLSPHGPGSYRLRVHVRGRDTNTDGVQEEPTEDYLVIIWPAPQAPELIIRLTDRCGYGLRLAASSATDQAATRPAELLVQERRRSELHQAILDGMTNE